MIESKKMWSDLYKIPIIGDFIISFGIIVVLTSVSSAGGFWGLKGEDKTLLINIFIYIGIAYFILSTLFRAYKYFKKIKTK
ncbi:hypothetical protein ACKGJI_08160 [Sulfurospirillum sp. 1307]|jgi:hypothetical protein